MPKLAANLSMMFTEFEFLDRFDAARQAGFAGVEFLFPYDYKAAEIAAKLKQNNLTQALFNLPPGDWEKEERGLAAMPGREEEFRQAVAKALEYAQGLNCKTLHVMAGIPGLDDLASARRTYVSNLQYAAREARKFDRTVIIEPINNRDIPGYFLNYQADAVSVIKDVDEPNIGLQFDLYHCQIMEGDLAIHFKEYLPWIRHIQIAGVPERHEPDIGEINYPYLFELMDNAGYSGWVGCEYRPKGKTVDGLGWMKPWRVS